MKLEKPNKALQKEIDVGIHLFGGESYIRLEQSWKERKQAKKEVFDDINKRFNELWSCLKFEKCSSKVIGYTFTKKEVDRFRRYLKKKHLNQTKEKGKVRKVNGGNRNEL